MVELLSVENLANVGVLLFAMVKLIAMLSEPFFSIHWEGVIESGFDFSTIVFLFGGVFIMYTAGKEISHLSPCCY